MQVSSWLGKENLVASTYTRSCVESKNKVKNFFKNEKKLNEISKVAKINYKKRILEYKELYTIWDMFTYLIRKLVLMLVVLILFTLLETFLNHWFYLVQCSKSDMMLMDHNLLTVLRLELTFFKMLKTVSFLILHLVTWNNFL